MTIKAILFDKDGTLIDFTATFGPATELVIADLSGGDEKIATDLAAVSKFDRNTFAIQKTSVLIAGSLEDIVVEWMKYLPDAPLDKMLERVDSLYEVHSLKSLAPFHYLNSTLDQLDAMNMPFGIGTNDSESTARAHMNALGLTTRFASIVGYDSGYGEKPGPGMVTAFADQMGLMPEEIFMVGDSAHDLMAGRAAGSITIAVTSGLADADALAPLADHVLADISHLPALVQRLNDPVSA